MCEYDDRIKAIHITVLKRFCKEGLIYLIVVFMEVYQESKLLTTKENKREKKIFSEYMLSK